MPGSTSVRPTRKVLIVDDHAIVRRGLVELIEGEPSLDDCHVCGEAEGVSEALQMVEKEKPELLIVDITLQDGNGLELIKQVKASYPSVKMLVSSMHDESLYSERALRAGALGFIGKHEDTSKLIEAIRRVLSGKVYLSQKMTEHMLQSVSDPEQETGQSPIHQLSDRELEVFEMIGQGLTTRQIAQRLTLSIKTIETHRESIKKKLNLSSGAELTRRAIQWVLEQE
jgi:DNA-binding NarL/FixJ family response regulator